MKSIILFLIILSGCAQAGPVKEQVTDTLSKTQVITGSQPAPPVDPYDNRPLHTFDTGILSGQTLLRNYVVQRFSSDLAGVAPSSVTRLGQDTAIIRGLGKTLVYTLAFPDSLPVVFPKKAYLMLSLDHHLATLLWLDDLHLVKYAAGQPHLIAGFFDVRSKGYFIVYDRRDSVLYNVFSTFDEPSCKNGIPVINASLDCISYSPYQLHIANNDVNRDGLYDLTFSGKVNYYCEGLETNIGRNDRQPLRSQDLTITFLAVKQGGQPAWKLKDTGICNLIARDF